MFYNFLILNDALLVDKNLVYSIGPEPITLTPVSHFVFVEMDTRPRVY